jgi:hypothetical protein
VPGTTAGKRDDGPRHLERRVARVPRLDDVHVVERDDAAAHTLRARGRDDDARDHVAALDERLVIERLDGGRSDVRGEGERDESEQHGATVTRQAARGMRQRSGRPGLFRTRVS